MLIYLIVIVDGDFNMIERRWSLSQMFWSGTMSDEEKKETGEIVATIKQYDGQYAEKHEGPYKEVS